MKKELTIDGIDYSLFKTKSNKLVEDFILDSRTYNDGLDYFSGSDCFTAYVYLVEKSNVTDFINKIEFFISKVEDSDVSDSDEYDYLEGMSDVAFLHKSFADEKYDVFFTNIDLDSIQEDNVEELIAQYEELRKELEELSAFYIYGGASYNDTGVSEFVMNWLYQKDKELVKSIFKDSGTDLTYIEDGYIDVKNFEMKEAASEDEMAQFVKFYSLSLPVSIFNPKAGELILQCIKEMNL